MTDERHLRTEIPRILRDSDPRPQSAAQILDRLTGRGLVVDRTEVQHACYLLERKRAITRRVRDGVVQWTAYLSISASTSSPVKDDRDASQSTRGTTQSTDKALSNPLKENSRET